MGAIGALVLGFAMDRLTPRASPELQLSFSTGSRSAI